VHLHQHIAGGPHAYTHAYADSNTSTYAYVYANTHTHTKGHAYADTDTHAAGDTGRTAYGGGSYANGGSCHGHASGAAVDRRQRVGAIACGLALGCPLPGRRWLGDSGGDGRFRVVA
jgi:hypothetical protein